MAAFFTILFLGARNAITNQFASFENHAAADDAQRVRNAYAEEVKQLERVSADVAPRDETYAFMSGKDPGFVSSDLSDEALTNLAANAVFFMDKSWRPYHSDLMDLDLETRARPDTAVADALSGASDLQRPGDPHGLASGVVPVGSGLMLVAARPITTSDFYAPPDGTLVVGRYLDESMAERLSAATKLNVSVYRIGAASNPPDVVRAVPSLKKDASGTVAALDNKWLATYSPLTDLHGNVVGVLRATIPRDVFSQGQSAINYLALSLLLLGAVATGTVYVVVDRVVLTRLSGLTDEVAGIAERGDSSARVDINGVDELGVLAEDINDMLSAIESSEQEIRDSRDALEERVRERTEALRSSETRYRMLIDQMADAVFTLDLNGRITLVNDCAEQLADVPEDELIGSDFLALMPATSAAAVAEHLKEGPSSDLSWTIEVQFGRFEGGTIPVELRAAPITNESGDVIGTQWVARDIAERKRFEAQLVDMASHDHLTGLYNRRYFETVLEQELADARHSAGCGAVLWLDIDDFKDVNDTLGHRAGDEVLVSLSNHLRKHVRDASVLARLGGDEFALLVPGVGAEEADAVAARLFGAIASYLCTIDGHPIRLTSSIGVVLYPSHGTTVEELLANADAAMYFAKESGRSRVYVYEADQEWREQVHSRIAWNERITDALQNDKFEVFAQPVLDLRKNDIVRYELLIRMRGDGGEIVQPADFLPTAERTGLIRDIDRWMTVQAIRLLEAHRDEEFGLEVNLSGRAFADAGLLKVIARALAQSDVDPACLGFEITETAAISDVSRAQTFIRTLKDLGCRFSLDDFGSGFSSFYYLKHLPIDCLKVDGSFIRGLAHNAQDQHLVRGIVEMCRGLGIEVVAEYVEDAEALRMVRELNLDFAQGYFIGRPITVDDAIAVSFDAEGL